MITPEMLNFARQQLGLGVSREVLEHSLKSAGWNDEDIHEAFSSFTSSNSTLPSTKQAPISATAPNSILHWLKVTSITIAIVCGGYFAYQIYFNNRLFPQAEQKAQGIINDYTQKELQKYDEQLTSLVNHASEMYQGEGFSILMPNEWVDDPSAGTTCAQLYGGTGIGWRTYENSPGGAIANNATLWVCSVSDRSGSPLNDRESQYVNDSQHFPDETSMERPIVTGATKATLLYPKILQSFGHRVQLYVHANGKLYFILGSINNGTTAQADGLKYFVESFRLSR